MLNWSKIKVDVNSILGVIEKGQIASNLYDFICSFVTYLFARFTSWLRGSFRFRKSCSFDFSMYNSSYSLK